MTVSARTARNATAIAKATAKLSEAEALLHSVESPWFDPQINATLALLREARQKLDQYGA